MTAKLIKICQRRTAWRKIRRPAARHASCRPSHGAAGDPQAGPTAASRPGFHLAGPATAARHATSPPRRPGNRRPPCDQPHLAAPAIAACHADQPTLQIRQPPPARHAALLHTGPTAAARRRRSSREADGCFTAPPPLHSQKGQRGQPKGPAVGRGGVAEGRGSRGKGLQREGVAEGRGAIGRPAAVSGMGLRRVWRSFFAGFVPFASLNIRFERVQTASQPYFYSRKRFTPRPHTHQIQPVAAPRQRSAPAGGSRDRHPLRLEDSLPFRPSVRHPETHGSGCRFVGS